MWWRHKRESDLDRELQSHLDLEAAEQGDPHAARRALGNLAQIKEDTRAAWGWTALERLLQDVRYAARAMRRRPVFTAVAVLSLAIGIGANTAIFAFGEAILIRTLPVANANRLVTLHQNNEAFGIENCCFRYGVVHEIRSQDDDFEDLFAVFPGTLILSDDGGKESINAEFVSGNYFSVLGIRAAAGRLIEDRDDGPEGTGAVAVISYRLWQRRFGGSPDAIGRHIKLNGEAFEILGVIAPGFTGSSLYSPRDIQIPASMMRALRGISRDTATWAMAIGRLKPGISRKQAEARLNALGRSIEKQLGITITDRDDFRLLDASQGDPLVQQIYSRPVVMLMLLVGVVLLVACANLTALLLVRSAESAREAGMRVALGASKLALLRRSFAESLMLSLLGGVTGWGVAVTLMGLLANMLRPVSPGLVDGVTPNLAVFGFSTGLTVLTAALFGSLPAWRAMRADPLLGIRGAGSHPVRRPLLSRAILAGQVALSLALLFCAGLFGRTLANMRALDLGFRPENLITLDPDVSTYTPPEQVQFFAELERRARQLPQASAVSTAAMGALSGGYMAGSVAIPGYDASGGVEPTARMNFIGTDYFRTLGIPVLAGREFTAEDREDRVTPVLVDETFARQFMAGDALGKSFSQDFGDHRGFQVVGVVAASNYRLLREDPQPTVYLPPAASNPPTTLQVRVSGNPNETIQQLRSLVTSIDPRLRLARIETMEGRIDDLLARERLLAFLSTFLGSVAVALSAIGLYGVLAFSVVRRTREVGIRIAIGARRASILALILQEAVWTVLAGLALGLPLALFTGHLASTLLYGLEAEDTSTAIGATLLLLLTATAAALIPALRATRLDPMTALRHE